MKSTPLWDGKVCVLQVSDASEHSMQIRALTGAADSSKAWELPGLVRKKTDSILQERYPECLPRARAQWNSAGEGPRAQASSQANAGRQIVDR